MLQKRGEKKAQITLFVILALVIVIIIAVIYLLLPKKDILDSRDREYQEEPVPEEFKPVIDYVNNCAHQLGLEAIKKMGAHGGYIDPFNRELSRRFFDFDPANPISSDLVSLNNDPEEAVPYYLHVPGISSYQNYQVATEAPTIQDMQFQLAEYIKQHLPVCIETFEPLTEKGFLVTSDDQNINVSAIIRAETIEIYLTCPLNITKENFKTQISEFKNIIRFPLKKYHDYANIITASEFATQYLEGLAAALIQYHAGVDFARLPPTNARTNREYVVTWSNSKVRHDMQGLLVSYVPALQVNNTREYQPVNMPIAPSGDIGNNLEAAEAGFFRYLILEIFNATRQGTDLARTSISFFYTGQPIHLKVQPSEGDNIRPDVQVREENEFLPNSQYNTYQFFYDVSFPVVVEIRGAEPASEIPEYSFLFALEANLIENKRVLEWLLGLGTADWDPSMFELDIPSLSIITPSGKKVTPRKAAASLFCDAETWISGDITISTEDKATGKPLEGVNIMYGCGDYDTCWVGSTELTGLPEPGLAGAKAEWSGKLPLCNGGYLKLSKPGYGSKTIHLTTSEGMGKVLETQGLYPKKKINISVKKVVMQQIHQRDSDWKWNSRSLTLQAPTSLDRSTEEVIISLKQTGLEAGASPVTAYAGFGEGGVDKQEVELVPGDYEISGFLMDHSGQQIPANCSRICTTPVIICWDYQYYPNNPIDISLWGGVKINQENTGLFHISFAELDNHNELELYIFRYPDLGLSTPPGGCIEHMSYLGNAGNYSKIYKSAIWPVFK